MLQSSQISNRIHPDRARGEAANTSRNFAGSVALLAICLAPLPALAETGQASYYGRELAGQRTASGERFNPNGMTAAHRTLPFGTQLRVTNLANGRSVTVRVNDRGPFVRRRILDVSAGAARQLGFFAQGTARIRVERQ